MTQLTIRPLTAADKAQWTVLWRDYLAFYDTTLPDSVYDTTFARLLGDDAQDFNGLVADSGQGLIGLTHYLSHRHAWKVENVIYLQDLFVSQAARGTGAGRKLIEAVYAEADKSGAASVYWMTQDFNSTARQLYDRVGMLTPFIKYQRP